MGFSLVVAADLARGIGLRGDLPWTALRKDMQYFKELTTGEGNNCVIMGRLTWESIPPRFRPLARRTNIVVSRALSPEAAPPTRVVRSLDEAIAAGTSHHQTFVIGGGKLYAESILRQDCDTIYYSRIHSTFDCDTFFPDFEAVFLLCDRTDIVDRTAAGDIRISFEKWKRK